MNSAHYDRFGLWAFSVPEPGPPRRGLPAAIQRPSSLITTPLAQLCFPPSSCGSSFVALRFHTDIVPSLPA